MGAMWLHTRPAISVCACCRRRKESIFLGSPASCFWLLGSTRAARNIFCACRRRRYIPNMSRNRFVALPGASVQGSRRSRKRQRHLFASAVEAEAIYLHLGGLRYL